MRFCNHLCIKWKHPEVVLAFELFSVGLKHEYWIVISSEYFNLVNNIEVAPCEVTLSFYLKFGVF